MEAATLERAVEERSDQRRVYVIDDDKDVRKSLHFLLDSLSITSWPFVGAADFIDQLDDLAPAPILLDIRMPQIDGLQLLQMLAYRDITWPVIIMSAHGDIAVAVRAMKLGATEFLEKPFGPDMLQAALMEAYLKLERTETVRRDRDDARILFSKLTKRECEVIGLLAEGTSNKDVANRLELSVRTVELYRANSLAKLGAKKVAEVVNILKTADLPTDGLGKIQN